MYPYPTHSEYYEQKEAEKKSNNDNNWSKKKTKRKDNKKKNFVLYVLKMATVCRLAVCAIRAKFEVLNFDEGILCARGWGTINMVLTLPDKSLFIYFFE